MLGENFQIIIRLLNALGWQNPQKHHRFLIFFKIISEIVMQAFHLSLEQQRNRITTQKGEVKI